MVERDSEVGGGIIAVPIVASIQIVVRELTAERRAEMARLRAGSHATEAASGLP